MTNVPSNFLKSVCAQNFLCATFYQHSSIFKTPCMKYVHLCLCALQIFLCAFISRPVRALTRAQLRGNIAWQSSMQPLDHSAPSNCNWTNTKGSNGLDKSPRMNAYNLFAPITVKTAGVRNGNAIQKEKFQKNKYDEQKCPE